MHNFTRECCDSRGLSCQHTAELAPLDLLNTVELLPPLLHALPHHPKLWQGQTNSKLNLEVPHLASSTFT